MKYCFLIAVICAGFYCHGQKLIIDTVCFNTSFDDYGIRQFEQEFLVVSGSPEGLGSIEKNKRFTPYSDVLKIQDCKLVDKTLFSKELKTQASINSPLNDGPISTTASGDLLFFTNNSNSSENKLGIFYSFKIGQEWSSPLTFPYNNEKYNVTHPFYDEKNKRLYYASDLKNGKSNYDIYYCDFNGETWGKSVYHETVNSDSTEFFPYVFEDKLYFSSNCALSVGGLDLFVFSDGKIENLGDGFNSVHDDLAILFTENNKGFFSSNRNSNGVHDDIFSFYYEPIPEVVIVEEIVPELIEEIRIALKEPGAIIFEFDTYAIGKDQLIKIDSLIVLLREWPEKKVLLSGHTDNIGSPKYNLELSKKRTAAVKKYLIDKGIQKDRIMLEYFGLEKPVASNSTLEGRHKNRRVEIKLIE